MIINTLSPVATSPDIVRSNSQPSLSEAADMWLRHVRVADAHRATEDGITHTEWQDIINRAALIDMMRRRGYR